jgi:hypothetical protein
MSFYIIEKEDQLPNLPYFDKCFVHIITNNTNYHPAISDVSLIYVKPFNDKGYIFCIDHNESLNLKWQSLKKLLSEKELYALDAKYTKYFLNGVINDVTFNYIERHGVKPDLSDCYPNIYSDCYHKFHNLKVLNHLIPISKHYEYCENIFNLLQDYMVVNSDYIHKLITVFFKIEKEGIKLDKEYFIKYYKDHPTPQFSISKGKIYTQYNLYTLTGRPSNSFNNINYAALNKENGERTCYIPSNDLYLEFDFNGYHPRLLGTLTGYEFDKETNVYEQIAKILEVQDISKVKETTFQNLYGGIRYELQNKPFFKNVNTFTDDLWDKIQYGGSITTPSGKVFRIKDIENPNPQKVLNYFIQNFETSQNVEQLSILFNGFKSLKSRIVLYTYDSILIDTVQTEIQQIKEIISKFKYPTKVKIGINYNELT